MFQLNGYPGAAEQARIDDALSPSGVFTSRTISHRSARISATIVSLFALSLAMMAALLVLSLVMIAVLLALSLLMIAVLFEIVVVDDRRDASGEVVMHVLEPLAVSVHLVGCEFARTKRRRVEKAVRNVCCNGKRDAGERPVLTEDVLVANPGSRSENRVGDFLVKLGYPFRARRHHFVTSYHSSHQKAARIGASTDAAFFITSLAFSFARQALGQLITSFLAHLEASARGRPKAP